MQGHAGICLGICKNMVEHAAVCGNMHEGMNVQEYANGGNMQEYAMRECAGLCGNIQEYVRICGKAGMQEYAGI